MAERRPLTIVHTIHAVTPAYIDAAIADAQNAKSALEAAGQKVLDDARSKIQRTAPDIEVEERFDLADPRDVLLQLSEGAAMLVVGSRGRGQLRSLLLGSVSVALVEHAHCPVSRRGPSGERGHGPATASWSVSTHPPSRDPFSSSRTARHLCTTCH